MQKIRRNGTTLVIVSHNLGALANFCARGIVLVDGRMHYDGPMADAIADYHASVELAVQPAHTDDDPSKPPRESGVVEALDLQLVDEGGHEQTHFSAGQRVVLQARA